MGILNRTIPPFWGWTQYTPVIPKLYWDVYSQEERIKRLCLEYDKLTHYASEVAAQVNTIGGEVDGVVEEVRTQLAEQDTKIDAQLAAQDAKIDAQLSAQDAKIDAQLAAQDAKIEELIEKQNGIIEAKFAEMEAYFNGRFAQLTEQLEGEMKELRDYVDEKFARYEQTLTVYDVTTGRYRPSHETMRRLFQALSYGFKGDVQLVEDVARDTVETVAMETVYNIAYANQTSININPQEPADN